MRAERKVTLELQVQLPSEGSSTTSSSRILLWTDDATHAVVLPVSTSKSPVSSVSGETPSQHGLNRTGETLPQNAPLALAASIGLKYAGDTAVLRRF
jgi:hypothetical protein